MFTNNYPYTDFHELNLDAMVNDLSTMKGDLSDLEERVTTLEESGGTGITVDTAMSSTSTNPVQNKVVYAAIEDAKSDIYSNFDSDQIANASTVYGDTVSESLQHLQNEINNAGMTVDTAMSSTSTNPVQNKVVYAAIEAAKDAVYANFDTDQITDTSNVGYGDTLTASLNAMNTKLTAVYEDYSSAIAAIG